MPLLAAGTGLDITVRLYAEQMAQSFGQPVVVENRPGSAGLVGDRGAQGGAGRRPHARGGDQRRRWRSGRRCSSSTPYDAQKDFVPIALYVKSPFILVVDPKLPIHSVAD